jgi:hypothetical protein
MFPIIIPDGWFSRENIGIRKYYILAPVGLIPAFGLIFCFVVAIKALTKYKSKVLLMYSILLVVANILLLLVLRDIAKKRFDREDVELEWKYMTPNFLSTIRHDLRDYKRNHGSYPNSLNKLSKGLMLMDIYSPVDSSTHRHGDFYYKSQADTFILFSVGLDQLPFTKDDIYPDTATKFVQKEYLAHPLQ